jgi:hypothetical protein
LYSATPELLQLLNSCLLVSESVDAELHEVDLFREPSHQKQVNGQQNGRHPEPCHRHRQMFAVELLKFVFIHEVTSMPPETRSLPFGVPRESLAYRPVP